jgi:hypothetical protein
MIGSVAGLYISDTAKTALQKAKLPMLGGIDTYMTQNSPQHTTGTRDDTTPTVNGDQSTTYAASKDTGTMDLLCQAFDATSTHQAGRRLHHCRRLCRQSRCRRSPNPTCSSSSARGTSYRFRWRRDPDDLASDHHIGRVSDRLGHRSVRVGHRQCRLGFHRLSSQNMAFHKNAFAMVMVPMVKPEGAVDVAARVLQWPLEHPHDPGLHRVGAIRAPFVWTFCWAPRRSTPTWPAA